MTILPPPPDTKTTWLQRSVGIVSLSLFVGLLTVGMTAVLSFQFISPVNDDIKAGQPASENIFAPRTASYTSAILTQEEKELANGRVTEVYSSLDDTIGRDQLGKVNALFTYIETVRADTQADTETKINYLTSVEDITIEYEVAENLLTLTDFAYSRAKSSVIAIVDEIMRREIKESQLEQFQRDARREVSLSLSPAQTAIVSSIAPQFIAPTIFPDVEATDARRAVAIDSVDPVIRDIAQGERLVQEGEMVTPLDIEALEQLGLLQPEPNWKRAAGLFLISFLISTIIALYWYRYQPPLRNNLRYLLALTFLILLFTVSARFMASGSPLLIYWFPITALALLIAVIFDVRFAFLMTAVIASLVGFINTASLEIALYLMIGGALALFTLQDIYAQRINPFFRAGLIAIIGHIGVVLIFALAQDAGGEEIARLSLYALGNGLLSAALTLVGFFIMGAIFGVTTSLQLQDLSRLDHPLLKELLRKAPGTYHHSIMVANLAEQAAERVNANSALVRVGAFYHDIGKMKRPLFFTENQEGSNPHDQLDPDNSARIIIRHVSDGLDLAHEHRLPDRIRQFIAEHHGQRAVMGFYMKAKALAEASGESAPYIDAYRYPGPCPRSRESGIVLLADAIEATSSALRPDTEKAIEKLVNGIVDSDLTEGQLNRSGLTMGDIEKIRASFIETLKGRFHVRVKYPGNDEMMEGEQK